MVTLMLFGSRPAQSSIPEGEAWLRSEAERLAALPGVVAARFIPLRGASAAWSTPCQWLVELDLRQGDQADRVAGDERLAALMADLRLLGLGPTMVLADRAATVELEPRR